MSTVTITAADVNKLRKSTGAGMMDCKKALVEADGDFDKAIIVLRKQGQKVAAKRADREASEGYVVAKSTGNFGAVVAVNCETDFVAKNEDFVAFSNKIMDIAMSSGAANLDALKNTDFESGMTIAEKIVEQTGVIGEKIDVSYFETINADKVVAYNHPGNKIASLVGVNQNDVEDAIVKDVAMQVAAMNPVALDSAGVSEDIKNREFELGKEQAIKEGKPENIVDKIANGKVQKFLKENTLVDQPFIKDNKQTVSQYLNSASSGLKVTEFKRYSLS